LKEILLIRHAKSSWKHPELEDIARPLNSRGKRDAPYMAEYIKNLGLKIDAIYTSPAVRASKTATNFKETHGLATGDFSIETDLYFGSEEDWMYLINSLPSKVKLPAFFSHNPTITYMANKFSNTYIENVPTCGIIRLLTRVESWNDVDYNNTHVLNTYFPKEIREQ